AKRRIQRELRETLGIRVNEPKPGGSGNSNDGNVARRFFVEHEAVARILRLNSILLKKCYFLLTALCSEKKYLRQEIEEKRNIPRERHKSIHEEAKRRIQRELQETLGIRVNKPKPGGSGNSNDGNVARRFFEKHEAVARILRFNSILLKKCYFLLTALCSGFPVDPVALKSYCDNIFDLYNEEYGWHKMPVTSHKILIHGPIVAQQFLLPIGMMSEEALESRNNHIKEYRRSFARKMSREDTMEDVFLRLLILSDPKISLMRNISTGRTDRTRRYSRAPSTTCTAADSKCSLGDKSVLGIRSPAT
uniref:Uncharacterized protein n=1 Tax=Lutzomyia longipalpis TaxID=7200 RepID=A0A1B0FUZ5_LUTLO